MKVRGKSKMKTSNEVRLIDATPILKDFWKIADRTISKNPYENVKINAYRRCFERVAYAPTVDAVPVVRCGKCKHYLYPYTLDSGETFGLCGIHDTADLSEYDFCSHGERKD